MLTPCHDPAARQRSYRLLAEAFGLGGETLAAAGGVARLALLPAGPRPLGHGGPFRRRPRPGIRPQAPPPRAEIPGRAIAPEAVRVARPRTTGPGTKWRMVPPRNRHRAQERPAMHPDEATGDDTAGAHRLPRRARRRPPPRPAWCGSGWKTSRWNSRCRRLVLGGRGDERPCRYRTAWRADAHVRGRNSELGRTDRSHDRRRRPLNVYGTLGVGAVASGRGQMGLQGRGQTPAISATEIDNLKPLCFRTSAPGWRRRFHRRHRHLPGSGATPEQDIAW